MKRREFPNGPSIGDHFGEAGREEERPVEPLHESEIAELDDHLDRSEWALTPGGSLEYAVNRQVSLDKRSAYRQEHGPPPEVAVPRQIDRQFEDAAQRDAIEHDVRHENDELVEESIRQEDEVRNRLTSQRALRESLAQSSPETVQQVAERYQQIKAELKRDWRYSADNEDPEKAQAMLREQVDSRLRDREAERTPEQEQEIDQEHGDVNRDFVRSSSDGDREEDDMPYELKYHPKAQPGMSPAEMRSHIDKQLKTLSDEFGQESEVGRDRDPGREFER